MISRDFKQIILNSTGADELYQIEVIQQLWSGYGNIIRYGLKGGAYKSVVVKHIDLKQGEGGHPRGWNTDLSHQRKVKSYLIEMEWYKNRSTHLPVQTPVPKCLSITAEEDEILIVLEDLDTAGFPARRHSVSLEEIKACIQWLAWFHAANLGQSAEGLWPVGCYWHLETRPDELRALSDKALKRAAPAIESKLTSSPFQTLVHGDAKLANFCFAEDGKSVAMVDFQYVGGGPGVKDLAYFVGSCLYEEECERLESELLGIYFDSLKEAVDHLEISTDVDALEAEWRALYPVAWCDFHRFLKGWSPGHWKINSYSEKLIRQVLDTL